MRFPRQNQEGWGGGKKICFQVPQTCTAVLPLIPRPPGSERDSQLGTLRVVLRSRTLESNQFRHYHLVDVASVFLSFLTCENTKRWSLRRLQEEEMGLGR